MNRSGIINEKELLIQLRNGDYNAFKEIYEIYASRLSYKLLQLLQSEELAEDILQDIFVKVWEIRETINPELSFGALLYKMASNLSKNEYRRNMYDRVMRSQIPPDTGHNPIEHSIEQAEIRALLDQALDQLTPRQKEVYVMHKLEGMTYQEISDTLNISVSAINQHIQKANKQLKTTLNPQYLYISCILLSSFLTGCN